MKHDTQTASLPKTLPKQFRQFFWDIDATKLDPGKHPLYVINRLLDKGNLEAARWVLRQFPRELIVETVKTRRDFSFASISFLSRYFNIPAEDIRCMQEPFRTLRKEHWVN